MVNTQVFSRGLALPWHAEMVMNMSRQAVVGYDNLTAKHVLSLSS